MGLFGFVLKAVCQKLSSGCDTLNAMSLRTAFYFFYFWFSVPGGREASA
jgi:hypothetical protein